MEQNSDKKLQEVIRELLDTDKDIRGYALEADVVNGEVTLQGVVDTLAEKVRLEEKLRQIPGVRRIENNITISTDGEITDADVLKEVREELNADPEVNLRDIGAQVSRGTVILRGHTDNPAQVQRAAKTAAKARGVHRVLNQVHIDRHDDADLSLEHIFHSQVRNDDDGP